MASNNFLKKYILKRWRRDVIPTELLRRRFTNSFDDSNSDMTAIDIFNTVDLLLKSHFHFTLVNSHSMLSFTSLNKVFTLTVSDHALLITHIHSNTILY
uniref:Uncharacterized protein n=1 Tax=Lactuca sativa TaxID=4236 RepID=A0A9R1W7M7_LACSA|nr:hypothetical protein LSAT_V11C200083570 [Lactuca sativa]